MQNDAHKITIEELCLRLNSTNSGLTADEARQRLKTHGPNAFEIERRKHLAVRLGRHFFNFFAILLWIGSALAYVAERLSPDEGNLYISAALASVVVLNALFTFFQEHQSEKIIESFRRMMPHRIEVLRDGQRKEILAEGLVPGDVIYLKEGDKIPADGRLIEESGLKVDNSSLTGESEPQLRSLRQTHENILESRNMVFSGTLVQAGSGAALVYDTGMDTQLGGIAALTRHTEEALSPLRKELNHFIRIISAIAIILGITFFALGLIKGSRLMGSMIFAIGIIVANVPEGLLPTVTLCLSMASKRMAKKKALIKKLESVETLGSTTVICTDKTGTITENRISVTTVYMNMDERNVHERGIGAITGIGVMLDAAILCNNARVDERGKTYGDPTEGALLLFANRYADIGSVIALNPRINEHPFDSNTRRMITANRSSGTTMYYLKGAPEKVLGSSDKVLQEGEEIALDETLRGKVMRHYERLASRGERVIALAYKKGGQDEERGFVFIALVGMIDPPRREVAGAVSKCKEAGIKVIMITGDYSITAEAIAKRAGMIANRHANIMTGDQLDALDDMGLKAFLIKEDLIFARATPVHKLRIVKTLKDMGEVVTVTGDGVNDAPALKQADMGVAMGISGTEVAKEASDMVLLDDNFATIVIAVEEGRTVFSNLRKFISYVLVSNVPEMLPFIAFVMLGIPLPLTIILILSIDLGTDLLPALGLGVETPEDDVMKKPPRPRHERLLTPKLLYMSYGVVGMVQACAGFFAYFFVLYSGGWTWGAALGSTDPLYLRAVTAFFTSIVVCQVADVMICRTRSESIFRKGLFTNKLVMLGIMTELLILWFIVFNPTGNGLFGTRPLSLNEILVSVPFAVLIILGDEFRKLMLRRDNRFVKSYLSWL